MTTSARPTSEGSSHWYFPTGEPCYEVERSDGKGMRPATLRDARKLGLLPSVTTILSVLRKPQLESWLIEQAVLAALTTPRLPNEALDAFVERVLQVERVQDQESDIAKKRGTEIHDALEGYFAKGMPDREIFEWIEPVVKFLEGFGEVEHTEHILVGNGYAGKCDLIQQRFDNGNLHIWDFKTTKAKKLPKEAYQDHVLQCAAYANALDQGEIEKHLGTTMPITTGNIYISTVEKGQFSVCEHPSWTEAYDHGFYTLLRHWRWANDYYP